MNDRVESLMFENDQSLLSHAKFKQMIGYRDRKKKIIVDSKLTSDFSQDLQAVKLPTDINNSADRLEERRASSAEQRRNRLTNARNSQQSFNQSLDPKEGRTTSTKFLSQSHLRMSSQMDVTSATKTMQQTMLFTDKKGSLERNNRLDRNHSRGLLAEDQSSQNSMKRIQMQGGTKRIYL